jgi:glucose-1-phosphate cytidylyltransferase
MSYTAVILAGGLGTRLGEITETIPKPMVKIGAKPILWHIMQNYASAGVADFVILAGYKSEIIKNYFANFGLLNSDIKVEIKKGTIKFLSNLQEDWNVTVVDTGVDALTGTRVARSAPYIKSNNFFLTYGDGLSDVNHNEVMQKLVEGNHLVTLTAVNPPGRYGQITVVNGFVKDFEEKKPENGYINGGFFSCSGRIFDVMESTNFSFENTFLPQLAEMRKLGAYFHNGFWQSMDTPRDVKYLNEVWNNNLAPWNLSGPLN